MPFGNPHVWPCRETLTETAKELLADIKGDDAAAQAHADRAREAQNEAVARGSNKQPRTGQAT